jgi:hypothetical protein
MESYIPQLVWYLSFWLSVNESKVNEVKAEDIGGDLLCRFIILVVLIILGNFCLLFLTNPKQLWSDVWSDIEVRKDIILPAFIVAFVNLIEFAINDKDFLHQLLHFLLEFLIVMTTYFSIIVYEFVKMERELKNYASFEKALLQELEAINDDVIIGIQTTEFQRMFEPEGLKYFFATASVFNRKRVTKPSLKFYRILLIYDYEHHEPINTWIANAIKKVNNLTKLEKQFQLYIQIHKENGIELHFMTQRRLHTLLQELKGVSSFSQIVGEICLSDTKPKKIKIEKLDCLILNGNCYPTAPSVLRGMNFTLNNKYKGIIDEVSLSIITDPDSSINKIH